ncbi:MAG: biotin--[acetyl-CoA-carboxylase] ligase [Desulfobacterales bacterium CG07_land_8_20_14_0_80_52_14]|nr:MAG: biotin--[acetyl-CoA-carboxylase] ligase [Desulfobacterales bacterium CG23_combo_of_CG06-09_8_20_14_all_52_9]PIU49862.1 MAG: biotin--[acetyl-CoA-carboxylase] ligase [Desulfobacterales bacterium CG07_land_8_20_14_0_80_52_14]
MKAQILSILRGSAEAVSGESIGTRLGVSRVAIFKQIGKLRELGYNIVSTPSGYQLRYEPDTLFPWAFPGREDRMHYFPETGSTMELARKLAREGCPSLTVVTADIQTRGRGRLDRLWQSEEGGLYFTVVTRPRLTPDACHQVIFVASWIVAFLLSEMYAIDARLKWPNDVLVQGKKIAGMLSEIEAESDQVLYVNIGIGINMNNDVSGVTSPATSVKTILGSRVSRRDFFAGFLDALEKHLGKEDFFGVLSRWKHMSDTLHRPVRIVTLKETIEGVAEDIDADGALVVRQKSGKSRRIVYGDCFHA